MVWASPYTMTLFSKRVSGSRISAGVRIDGVENSEDSEGLKSLGDCFGVGALGDVMANSGSTSA